MLGKLDNKILALSKIAGVEVQLLPEGKVLYHLVVLEKNKNVIGAVAKVAGIRDIAELKKNIPANTPVVILLNGRGIINRRITDTSLESDSQVLSSLLPNAKQEDFYLQKFLSGKYLFASVIRKELFEEVFASLRSQGVNVINASTGPFIVHTVAPFLPGSVQKLQTPSFLFTFNNGVLEDFTAGSYGEEEVSIGDDKLTSALGPAYAIALAEFLNGEQEHYVSSEALRHHKEEYGNQQLFKIYGYALLGFFVMLLMGNYMFYSYLKSEASGLAAQSGNYRQTLEEVKLLQKKVEEKENFMKKAGWFSTPKTSYYADDIASTIPASIKLTALKVNPLNDKISKKERKDVFRSDTIVVGGVCNNPTVLNPWMGELKERQWIESLSHVNYEHDPKTGSGIFQIEIRVKDGL